MAKTRKPGRKAAAPRPVWKLTLESPKRPKQSNRLRNFKCRRIYHVFQRGNEGRRAFRCDEERLHTSSISSSSGFGIRSKSTTSV